MKFQATFRTVRGLVYTCDRLFRSLDEADVLAAARDAWVVRFVPATAG